jgi:hypothetical protein
MKRGISFEIPHEFGSLLWEIVMPFGVTEFVWASGGEESYLVEDNKLQDPLFPKAVNGIDGLFLRKLLEENRYYLIFVTLQAYPKGKKSLLVETYEEFVSSDCQLVLLVVDSIYVTIYCKDKEKLEGLYQNAKVKGFHNLAYVTDENDTRTRLSVW